MEVADSGERSIMTAIRYFVRDHKQQILDSYLCGKLPVGSHFYVTSSYVAHLTGRISPMNGHDNVTRMAIPIYASKPVMKTRMHYDHVKKIIEEHPHKH